MNRFLSNAVNRIDAKGRVSVPAHFRSVLQQRGYGELYAIRELDVPALNVGGMVLCGAAYEKALNSSVFPGNQGGPLMHVIAAKAVALREAATPEFRAYQAQILANARALAAALMHRGFRAPECDVSGSRQLRVEL